MLETIILGIVQGLTEFLPISSSAHLVIFQKLLGWNEPELLFDIILHIATLVAVLIYFRKDIINLFKDDFYTAKLIILGSIPTALIGFFLKDHIENIFSEVYFSATFLLVTGILLFLAQRKYREDKSAARISVINALIIGTIQGMAILPGISRSGSTIAIAMILGIQKERAARFSFLLAIPAICGAALLGFKEFSSSSINNIFLYISGFIAALIAGYFAIIVLFKVISKNKLSYFAYYCFLVGLIVLIFTIL